MSNKSSRHRVQHEYQPTLSKHLQTLGWDSLRRADQHPLPAHGHDGFEICLIVRGAVDWWVENEVHEVGPGDVYITKPHEVHGGVDALLHAAELYWTVVRFTPSRNMAGMSRTQAQTIANQMYGLRLRKFPGSAHLQNIYEQLIQEYDAPGLHTPVLVQSLVHQLLVTVVRDHDRALRERANRSEPISPPVQQAMDWMLQHLDKDYSIDALAGQVGLSVARFHDIFREQIGFSPGDWRNRQRIRKAKSMLRHSEKTVTQIALQCGFASSQYFATAFRRLAGMSPREYRNRVQ